MLLPFPTPFDKEGRVELTALRANIEKWNETGVAGYVALGSTGERVHLDEREYISVIEAARDAVPAHLTFIAGAGQHETRATIREIKLAADAGADAVLVIPPHFYRAAMTSHALIKHYMTVAEASPVPLLLYSVPQFTGLPLTPDTVARLSEHENICGIKDSSSDLVNLMEMLRQIQDDFKVVTGHAGIFHAALSAGAEGAILAAACVVPRAFVALYEAFVAGNDERARAIQKRVAPLAQAVTVRFGIGGLKAALDLCGYRGGVPRLPLAPPSEEGQREIARLIAECIATDDFINDTVSQKAGATQ